APPEPAADAFVPAAALLPEPEDGAARWGDEALDDFNGYGGFAPAGDEYVIRLETGPGGRLRLPPLPWTNVLANEGFGCLVTETGAGCTWSGNSRENRLT